ncbi:CvpA family protein [Oecophyllibacter saccharovorans]|uniref:CvpA family protein n=1 Tax=Oecophyllibacter saccharovorans TaxID=2558360 RepID=A0A506UM56_9PROT|nr:CvpA family protein [Oecophyllibacter saccharovorans]QDH15477.1 CvpA family protein [Oecophyllibacter saccharovorans]TPW34312.1 CvpA family protein [Oecophyllibacter saccharovorans]TPW36499.1 CvpA family protein [Oecophyllibacter saccharovorans]
MSDTTQLGAGGHPGAGFLEHLGVVDISFLVILALSVLWGMVRGFSRETGGVLVWIGAIWAAFRIGDVVVALADRTVAPMLRDSAFFHGTLRFAVFLVSLMVLGICARLVARQLRGVLSGGVDAVLGAVFGLLRGYVILVLVFLVLAWAAPDWLADLVRGSVIGPWILRGVAFVQGHLPASLTHQLQAGLPPGA